MIARRSLIRYCASALLLTPLCHDIRLLAHAATPCCYATAMPCLRLRQRHMPLIFRLSALFFFSLRRLYAIRFTLLCQDTLDAMMPRHAAAIFFFCYAYFCCFSYDAACRHYAPRHIIFMSIVSDTPALLAADMPHTTAFLITPLRHMAAALMPPRHHALCCRQRILMFSPLPLLISPCAPAPFSCRHAAAAICLMPILRAHIAAMPLRCCAATMLLHISSCHYFRSPPRCRRHAAIIVVSRCCFIRCRLRRYLLMLLRLLAAVAATPLLLLVSIWRERVMLRGASICALRDALWRERATLLLLLFGRYC